MTFPEALAPRSHIRADECRLAPRAWSHEQPDCIWRKELEFQQKWNWSLMTNVKAQQLKWSSLYTAKYMLNLCSIFMIPNLWCVNHLGFIAAWVRLRGRRPCFDRARNVYLSFLWEMNLCISVQELCTSPWDGFACPVTDTASNRISSGRRGRLKED